MYFDHYELTQKELIWAHNKLAKMIIESRDGEGAIRKRY